MTKLEVTQEGANAFASGILSPDCPYPKASTLFTFWQHGWWKAFYLRRNLDAKRIAYWLEYEAPVQLGLDDVRSNALAYIVTTQGRFDRNQPIADNRIAGVEFTIPAPATLPDPPVSLK